MCCIDQLRSPGETCESAGRPCLDDVFFVYGQVVADQQPSRFIFRPDMCSKDRAARVVVGVQRDIDFTWPFTVFIADG